MKGDDNMVVRKSPSADSRSAQSQPTVEELKDSTISHIGDVQQGMNFIANMIIERGKMHDNTKMDNMEEFHAALTSGHIKDTAWYNRHINDERHHLKSHVPDDVTLVDVIEHLVDCTMAGLTRSGQIYDIDLSTDVLQLAAANTVELLKGNITVVDDESGLLDDSAD